MNLKAQLAKDAPLEADFYIGDNNWWMEQKLDGQRFLVIIEDGALTALNRHGVEMTVPPWLLAEFMDGTFSKHRWVFDGELVGSEYHIFDCLHAGKDMTGKPFSLRRAKLEQIYDLWHPGKQISLTRIARNAHDKSVMYTTLYDACAEGAVVKRSDAKYVGKKVKHMLKLKFVTDCDVEVMELERDGKPQAITVGCVGPDGKIVEVSGCKIPAGVKLAVGDVITVNYLYATEDDKLTQPTFKCVRTDTTADTVESLKHTSKAVL